MGLGCSVGGEQLGIASGVSEWWEKEESIPQGRP